jgi:predicted Rossmann fold nucleotide-binding protein DprA/Smf involved in DNA uptake
MRDKGACVISGFHSKVEKDALTYLLKGKQPIIVVLGRTMYKKTPKEWILPLREKRMLIITTNSKGARYSVDTAEKRNRYITEISHKVVFGCLNYNSSLYPLYHDLLDIDKKIKVLSDL